MRILRDTVLTLVLAIVMVELGLYTICVYSPFRLSCGKSYSPYIVGALIVMTSVIGVLFIAQFKKTHMIYKPRVRSHPLPASFFAKATKTFENAVDIIWNTYDSEAKDSVSRTIVNNAYSTQGWVIRYNSGFKLVIYERDFYYWLMGIVKTQMAWQQDGTIRVKSPLSQRESGLTRSTWLAYRQLLVDAKALKQLNGNVVALKEWAMANPQQVIEEISSVRELLDV